MIKLEAADELLTYYQQRRNISEICRVGMYTLHLSAAYHTENIITVTAAVFQREDCSHWTIVIINKSILFHGQGGALIAE